VTLSFKVNPEIKTALENLAKQEDRSVSNYVVRIITKHFKEKGIDLDKKPPKK